MLLEAKRQLSARDTTHYALTSNLSVISSVPQNRESIATLVLYKFITTMKPQYLSRKTDRFFRNNDCSQYTTIRTDWLILNHSAY